MRKVILTTMLVLFPLFIASWSAGQNADEEVCQKLLQGSCTECHSTERICGEIGQEYVDWPGLVSDMGGRANLSQEEKDTVLDCLTKAAEPGKFVCTNK